MSDPLRLFDTPPLVEPAADPPVSPTRRRTVRQHAALARGRHPATGLPLLRDQDHTQASLCCGDCAHVDLVLGGGRTWWKCRIQGDTRSPATDVRISWPACVRLVRRDVSAPGIQRGRYPQAPAR